MISHVLFSSESENWETPAELYRELNERYHFELDPCASAENHKCERYYTKEQNGLEKSWGG